MRCQRVRHSVTLNGGKSSTEEEVTTTAPTSTRIPGYVVGTWDIDPVHSDVSFTVRHMMVSKVRGRPGTFSGEIVTAPQFTKTG